MLNISKNIESKIKRLNKDNVYVVADFDRTITKSSSSTSWSILANSSLVPETYKKERQDLYDIYRPLEISTSLSNDEKCMKVKEWYTKHINLFVKYQVAKELFEKASKDKSIMEFREGVKEFLTFLKRNNIPLIIISAGIGNFIECFLKNNDMLYDNIYISSNMILFDEGKAVGVEANIIHSLNKNEVSLPNNIKERIKDRQMVLLLGDQISDKKMVVDKSSDDVISVGFLTADQVQNKEFYEKEFDIVCSDDTSYVELQEYIFKGD